MNACSRDSASVKSKEKERKGRQEDGSFFLSFFASPLLAA
jgi:hypothetical protein